MSPAPLNDESAPVADHADRRRKWRLTAAVVLVAASVGVGVLVGLGRDGTVGAVFAQDRSLTGGLGSAAEDAPTRLPAQVLPSLGPGADVDLSDYLGSPMLVNFWATWCGPCITEMPVLRDTSRQLAGQVTFLGINVQDNEENALEFLQELDVTYDQARDPLAEYFTEVGGFGMPTTLLIDEAGTIVYRHTGAIEAAELRDLLTRHLDVRSGPAG